MKCNIPKTSNKALIQQAKIHIVSAKEEKITNQVYLDAYNEIFDKVRDDVVSQVMATCMYELNKEFGFGKERLGKFFDGVSAMFLLMRSGVMGQEFTTENCIEHCEEQFGIKFKCK